MIRSPQLPSAANFLRERPTRRKVHFHNVRPLELQGDIVNQLAPASRFDAEPSVNNHFAWIRTRLALESTYLAWIRTAISLIGFGFTIVQFFQRMQGMKVPGLPTMRPERPRDLGLTLIAAGVGALVVSSWQYFAKIKYLNSKPFESIAQDQAAKPYQTTAFISAMVLIVIGIAAFVSVFFRFM